MSRIKLYKKSIFLIFLLFRWIIADAQTGIFFQAIARDNNTNPARDRKIFVQSNIVQATPTGTKLLTKNIKLIQMHMVYLVSWLAMAFV